MSIATFTAGVAAAVFASTAGNETGFRAGDAAAGADTPSMILVVLAGAAVLASVALSLMGARSAGKTEESLAAARGLCNEEDAG